MVIKVLDIVDKCQTNADGYRVYVVLKKAILDSKDKINVSFSGVDSVPSSFVNSAFIQLLDDLSFDVIKARIGFIDSNSQINGMIKKRFQDETSHSKRH